MIAIPFIYFSILLLFILKTKKTFDISAYIVSLYVLISFFSIIIDMNGLRSQDTVGYEISIIPAFLYCLLLTLTIWPFYKFNSKDVISITLNKPRLFNTIVYLFFASFILIVFSSIGSVIQILNGDANELRMALYKGESMPDVPNSGGIFGPFLIIANVLGGFSILMLLFYFYSISFLNKTKLFNTVTLLSSMTIIIIGILGIDRSKTVYWMLTFGLMLILFWPHLSKQQRKKIFKLSSLLLGIGIAYFLSITLSRFGERETGAEGGIISYAGQSFINFCFFFDMVEYREFSLQRIFPLFYKLFIDNGIEGSGALNEDISFKTGKFAGIFSTFIGDIMIASGKIATILFCLFFNLVANKALKWKNKKHINFYQILVLFCLITFPLLGPFVYFYATFPRTLALLLCGLYVINLRLENFRKRRASFK